LIDDKALIKKYPKICSNDNLCSLKSTSQMLKSVLVSSVSFGGRNRTVTLTFSRAVAVAVKGATKSKCAAPKQKYLEATSSSDALKTIFASLEHRLRENSWTFINFSSDIGNEQTLRFDNQFIDNNNSLGRHNTIISTTATTATNPFLNTQNPLVLQQQHHSPIINQQQLILNHISVTPSSLSPATSDTNPFRASIAPTKFTSFT
ncbi:2101_t:CDS:2, partial [Entrophospora sp. SA101]